MWPDSQPQSGSVHSLLTVKIQLASEQVGSVQADLEINSESELGLFLLDLTFLVLTTGRLLDVAEDDIDVTGSSFWSWSEETNIVSGTELSVLISPQYKLLVN